MGSRETARAQSSKPVDGGGTAGGDGESAGITISRIGRQQQLVRHSSRAYDDADADDMMMTTMTMVIMMRMI